MSRAFASLIARPFVAFPLLAALALPYFVHLGKSSLWDANEAFYAETPREMLESGDYLAPRFNYQPRPQKPPLAYWIVAASYKLFGISEFAVRLPGALAALGAILFTFGIGRRLVSPAAGWIAAAMLATTPRLFILARRLPIDVYLGFFLAGAAYFLVRALGEERSRLWSAAAAVFVALAFLTKGPVALVIAGLPCVLYALLVRRDAWARLHLLFAAGIVAALVVPWYVSVYWARGWDYIAPFFLRDNLARFATERFGPERGLLFYFPSFAVDFFPWSVLSLGAAVWIVARRRDPEAAPLLFPALWCASTFVFFSLSKNKQDYYLAPLYPMAAVLVAGALERTLPLDRRGSATEPPRGWSTWWPWLLFAVSLALFAFALVALFALGAAVPDLERTLHYAPAAGLIAASLGVIGTLVRARPRAALASVGATMWLLLLASAAVYLPAVEPFRPVREMCRTIAARAGTDDEVGYYRTPAGSMAFYLRRQIFEEFDPDAMVRRFLGERAVYCLLTEGDYNYFVGRRDLILYVLDRRARLVTQLRLTLDEETRARQELLLVSNRPAPEGRPGEGREIP